MSDANNTPAAATVNVHFINNSGSGFADNLAVEAGLTMQELFQRQMGKSASAGDYLIRVNRQVVAAGYVLAEGDRVSVTPAKIKGARR